MVKYISLLALFLVVNYITRFYENIFYAMHEIYFKALRDKVKYHVKSFFLVAFMTPFFAILI